MARFKKETQAIAALGHDYGEWTQTKASTYTEEGEETRICAHDATHKENRPIPRIPFASIASLGTWLTSQPANTAASAYTVALNVNDISDVKTTLINSPDKYVYLELSDSTITSIPDYAFCIPILQGDAIYGYEGSCTTLVGINIPDSVISIGSSAFYGCTNLASVAIPNSVTSIRNRAFIGCTSLTSVTFQGTITSDNLANDVFNYNTWSIGDLRDKYLAANGGVGTYTTTAPVDSSSVWTKQP